MHLRTIQQIWVSILFLHWHLKIETLHLVTRQEAYLYFKLVHSFLPIKRKSYPVILCPMYLSLLSIHIHTNDLATSSYNCFFSGGFLLGRTLAAVMTVTLSTSMAARQGPLSMAAHQIILQVWLSASLLADAQSSSSQVAICFN